MAETIMTVLMKRDGNTHEEAKKLVDEAREEFHSLIGQGRLTEAGEVCYTHFGLEPDFIEELM